MGDAPAPAAAAAAAPSPASSPTPSPPSPPASSSPPGARGGLMTVKATSASTVPEWFTIEYSVPCGTKKWSPGESR